MKPESKSLVACSFVDGGPGSGLRFAGEDNDVDTVTVKREVLCNHCSDDLFEEPIDKPDDEETLLDFLDSLTLTEQRAALIHLSAKWAELEGRKVNGR